MTNPNYRKNTLGLHQRVAYGLRKLVPHSPRGYLAWCLVPVAVATSLMAVGSGTPPSIPKVTLAAEPMYAAVVVDKPAMALALSVEFPTVGAQYTPGGSSDDTYTTAKEYLGYYDAESCYAYNDNPTETPTAPQTAADYKRFDRTGAATGRKCSNAFSGNFLNWASSSAIDMLRLALSGGDRYIDTASLTVLQRAIIPNGDPTCMWNSSNFPSKRLIKDGGSTGGYWGAVPVAMITAASGNDIYVANTLNRIYFGTSQTGGCGNTSAYTLSSNASSNAIGPISDTTANLPTGATWCANEGGTCSFSGVKQVWYGADSGGTRKWKVAPANNGVNCTNAVFGDPWSGQYKGCYIANYTGSWTPPASAGALNSDGFFYARVQVCNVNSGTLQDNRDYNFCKQYPNGNYKPTGVIQKYSDQIRLAAFGYLLDQTASYSAGRYGGVLRAPMKYVGAKTYNINGQDNTPAGGNPKAEWNANTGIFNTNPDSNASPAISGVINYLNMFGRTGPTPGVYKKYDPVGELHYETLRYLQGLSPSADAISGTIDATMADGFPYFTTWDDPYGDGRTSASDYSCVKSNIVVVGDINTHDGNRLPSASNANNIPDINYWRGIVQKFEKNSGGTYTDGLGNTQTIANPNTANGSVPSATDRSQIMGSAYWARTHDIRGSGWTAQPSKQRPGLRVKTFIFDVNEYGAQNDATTRRNANQFFTASKYGGFETDPSNPGKKPYNIKGNPFKDQNGVNDNNVWQKAAEPGEASTYYVYNTSKTSPARDVLTAFDEIFSRASTSSRSVAGGGLSTSSKVTSGSLSYSAKFDTSNWNGDVVAEPISQNATTKDLVIGAPLWSAAQRLDNMTSPAANRKIFVGRTGATNNPAATAFTWAAIDPGLQADLNKANPAAATDTLGADRLAYLRGNKTKEGAPFRVRSSLLGDIVNSNIVYSGAPSKAFTDTGYTAFRSAYGSRTAAVFAGGNDGMLHAFNAATGDELFAFIPSWLGRNLSALADPAYINNHQNYVDAPAAVGEAQVANTGSATDWKTVLVSGTGGGGSGVFALDVSDPSNFSASNVMWEFTRADDEDMGQVVGEPKILKIKTSGTSATATYRWFAVVGSGVNNYVPDSANRFSATGKPALFLLALDKPAGAAWSLGTNYFKVSVPTNATLAGTQATGLANFSALFGAQGEMTDIYMGDLHGSLWRLKFSGKPTTDWNMDKLSFFNKGSASSPDPYPMFIARTGDATPKVQPIFAAPTPFVGPTVGGVESFYVTFGTGKYLESGDNISTTQQSFYVVYDNGSTAADSSTIASAISGRGRLAAGALNTTTRTVSVSAFKWGRPASNTDTTQRAGWYFDLPDSGERINQASVNAGSLYAAFNSTIPGSTAAGAGSCTNTLGGSNQYFLNINNGSGRYTPSTMGLLGQPVMLSSDDETVVTKSDSTGKRIRTVTLRRFSIGQGGPETSAAPETTQETIGRLSWRQIFNYQDMKNK